MLQVKKSLDVLLFCFVLFLLFRAAPVAHGHSQARGRSELQLLAYATATAMGSKLRL